VIPAAIMIALWVGWFLAQNIGSVDSRFAYRHPLVTVLSGRNGTVQRVEKHSFESKIDFLIQLDIKLEIKERYNYRISNR
jgi:hypothetical protein